MPQPGPLQKNQPQLPNFLSDAAFFVQGLFTPGNFIDLIRHLPTTSNGINRLAFKFATNFPAEQDTLCHYAKTRAQLCSAPVQAEIFL